MARNTHIDIILTHVVNSLVTFSLTRIVQPWFDLVLISLRRLKKGRRSNSTRRRRDFLKEKLRMQTHLLYRNHATEIAVASSSSHAWHKIAGAARSI